MSHFRRLLLAGTFLVLPPVLAAQTTVVKPAGRTATAESRSGERSGASSRPTDPNLARAYALVIAGKGAAGRTIVDSVLAATPPGSLRYAEVLYWHAVFAASTATAERDYRQLSVEFPLSNRAADALITLAQLEYVRGDTTLAVHHLQRLMIEHPAGVRSAKANSWAAGVLFDAQDPVRGCAALRAARATANPDEAELRNQIEIDLPKCGARPSAAVARAADASADGAPVATRAEPSSAARAVVEKVTAEKVAAAKAPLEEPVPPEHSATPKPAMSTPRSAPAFAVQVGAYTARPTADTFATKLVGRGYAARVTGSEAPFRVQVGRYASRAEAAGALKRMRAAKLDGFVVETSR